VIGTWAIGSASATPGTARSASRVAVSAGAARLTWASCRLTWSNCTFSIPVIVSSMVHEVRITSSDRMTPTVVNVVRLRLRPTPRSTSRTVTGACRNGGTRRSARLRAVARAGRTPRIASAGAIRAAATAGASADSTPTTIPNATPVTIVPGRATDNIPRDCGRLIACR
jgi:hypothetical protein